MYVLKTVFVRISASNISYIAKSMLSNCPFQHPNHLERYYLLPPDPDPPDPLALLLPPELFPGVATGDALVAVLCVLGVLVLVVVVVVDVAATKGSEVLDGWEASDFLIAWTPTIPPTTAAMMAMARRRRIPLNVRQKGGSAEVATPPDPADDILSLRTFSGIAGTGGTEGSR